MFLIQIVPRLPPNIDGIGDHALRLAECLRANHGIDSGFVVADPRWDGNSMISGFPVVRLESRSVDGLTLALLGGFEGMLSRGRADGILLQFAPYGYERRGCPIWLLQALSASRGRASVPLLLMLHELDADGMGPLNSAFWLSALQRRIIRKLVSYSSATFTNTAFHRNRLLDWHVGSSISLLPSFSTIGEPATNKHMAARERQLVIFGRPSQRRMAYAEGASDLEIACKAISAKRIVDIGEPVGEERRSQFRNIPILYKGTLDAADVSATMENSLGSFLRYPEALLTKSSIFAGSCAHGTIPFVSSTSVGSLRETELTEGCDYVSIRGKTQLADAYIKGLSETIFTRYQTRSTRAAAKQVVATLLAQNN